MSKFLKFIVNLFLAVAILTAAAILIPPVLGVNTTIVDSAGMDTNLPLGSVTYSVDIPVTRLQKGDEILKENGSSTYAYIIEEGDAATGKYKVSSAVDRDSVSEITLRNTISLVKLCIPYIGYVVVAMQTVEGIIIIVLVVLFIIILFVLSELWKSRDDDDDADDNYDDGGLGAAQPTDGTQDRDDQMKRDFEGISKSDTADSPDRNAEFQEVPDQGDHYGEGDDGDFTELPATDSDASFYAEPIAEYPYQNGESGAYSSPEDEPVDISEPVTYDGTSDTYNGGSDVNAEFAEEIESGLAGTDGAAESAFTEEEAEPVSVPEITAEAYDRGAYYEENNDIDLEPNQFVAARRFTLDEILDQARKRGGEPKVSKDDVSGVSIVDYSDLI